MPDDYELDQESARALVDAGYMPLSEYLELCRERGWESRIPDATSRPDASASPPLQSTVPR